MNAGGPNAETVTFDYDNAGQLVRTTMADGSVLRYHYDAAHRLTEIADGLGNVIQYTLDAMGNRIKEDVFDPSDRLQRTQQRVYDLNNRLYNDIGAAGQKSVLLVRRQWQSQDCRRSARQEHAAQLRCVESAA